MTPDDAKTLGIIGGLVVSSIALFLNFYSTLRSIKSQRLANHQEITKSHRELWKLTLDKPEKYSRILSLDINILDQPITYEEKRFAQLIFLHMVSAYSFVKYNHMLEIEKMEMDFAELLSLPIPRIVWTQTKKYYNSDFVKFVENSNKPHGLWKKTKILIRKMVRRMYTTDFSKIWRVLILSAFSESIRQKVEGLGDQVICMTDKDEEVTPEFIKDEGFDFIICFGYGKILKKKVLDLVPCINVHGGYLPYNKGPNPNLWSWIDDTKKGVTIHYIDKGVDTGDIIAQREIELSGAVTLQTSFNQLVEECKKLFFDTWPDIRSGTSKRIKQTGEGASHRLSSQRPLASLLDGEGLNIPIDEFCEKARILLAESK